jgi:hypothetical protein
MVVVVPTNEGRDLDSSDRKYGAHVRHEAPRRETKRVIAIDVFKSKVGEAARAHVESEYFPLTKRGAADPTDFLLGYGLGVAVGLRRK